MRLTSKETDFAVLDEVFEKDVFERFWAWFNHQNYAYRSITGWQKVWRINDGEVLGSNSYYHTKAPFGNEMDLLHQTIIYLAREHLKDIVGEEGKDWKEVNLMPYLYPVGTKLSWHDDYGYSGACIFYPHPKWDAHWGGELFVAKTPPDYKASGGDLLTRSQNSDMLNVYGMGVYIAPVPNRLVFTRGGVWHNINRVDQAAGDNIRCSVVAFFMKEPANG